MAAPCECRQRHQRRRVVLTGGPGAGKTAVLELVRRSLCRHVIVLPESAGIVFAGGFPRRGDADVRRAAQHAIFCLQRELENAADAEGAALVLCDRGMVDGMAYWPGPEDFWAAVGMTHAECMARYDAVIHLRTPNSDNGYGLQNPLRIESAVEAAAIDERIARAWEGHPSRYEVPESPDFATKANQALVIVRAQLPACCRSHLVVGAAA